MINTSNEKGKVQRVGSGVVLSRDLIATNYHVIEKAAEVRIRHKGKEYPARLRHRDRDVCTFDTEGMTAPPGAKRRDVRDLLTS